MTERERAIAQFHSIVRELSWPEPNKLEIHPFDVSDPDSRVGIVGEFNEFWFSLLPSNKFELSTKQVTVRPYCSDLLFRVTDPEMLQMIKDAVVHIKLKADWRNL